MKKKRIWARKVAFLYLFLIIAITLIILAIFFLYFTIIISVVFLFLLLVIAAKEPRLLRKMIRFIRWIIQSIYHPFISHYRTWNQGAKGEELVDKWLGTLGDGYFILKDVMLPGKKGNIDHVILGKNGIFVIETKTHKGFITCEGDLWMQEKIGRGGSRYKGNIGNPSKQVKGNAIALRNFFEQYYPKLSGIWIHGIVVFANEESRVKVINPTVPVLKLSQLIDFIKRKDGSFNITIEDYLQIKEILESKKKH
jgi:energy-coupling factor transporter transmembrane protein EcfT